MSGKPLKREARQWLDEFLCHYRKNERIVDLGTISPAELLGLTGGEKIDRKEDDDDQD